MPLQETLTGVTFPGSNLLNVNTIPNPLAYFGSLLKLWLKADAGVTNDGSNNATLWNDQSGNGVNLLPATVTAPISSANPQIIAAAQNGLPGIRSGDTTVGHSQYLRAPYNAALDFSASTPFSVILAYLPVIVVGATYPCEIGTFAPPGTGGWCVSAQYQTLKPTFRLINIRQTIECAVGLSNVLPTGVPVILQCVSSGSGTAAGLSLYVNNVLQAVTTQYDALAGASIQNPATGLAAPSTGTGAFGTGRSTVYEAIVVSKALTAHDVAVMDAYLNARWAIHA